MTHDAKEDPIARMLKLSYSYCSKETSTLAKLYCSYVSYVTYVAQKGTHDTVLTGMIDKVEIILNYLQKQEEPAAL